MKILHAVEYYYPSHGGMQEVVRQLSERMILAGHQVSIATTFLHHRKFNSLNGVDVFSFNVSGNSVNGMKGEVTRFQDFLLKNDFDVITNFAAQQWTTDATFEIINQIQSKKVFVPTGFSALKNPLYSAYFKKMPDYLKSYDAIVFSGEKYRDFEFAKSFEIKGCHVIPNGVDINEFNKSIRFDVKTHLKIPKHFKIISHIGTYTGFKGQKEAMEIFLQANIGNAVLLLMGGNINQLKKNWRSQISFQSRLKSLFSTNKKIFFCEFSREKMIDSLKQSDLFLFPSNVECSPIVLFEAMAAGVPFLATDIGNVKEIVEWTQAGEILKTEINEAGYSYPVIKESANHLKDILNDVAKLKLMNENGKRLVSEKFSWDKITTQYLNLYQKLLDGKTD